MTNSIPISPVPAQKLMMDDDKKALRVSEMYSPENKLSGHINSYVNEINPRQQITEGMPPRSLRPPADPQWIVHASDPHKEVVMCKMQADRKQGHVISTHKTSLDGLMKQLAR